MKYKIGDKVRVREDLEVNKSYGRGIFTSRMIPLKGKILTIDHMDSYNYYIMREDPGGYRWVGEMLLPINDTTKYKIGDKVLVREDLIAEQVYGENICTSEMASFKGKIVTIKKVCENKYIIKEVTTITPSGLIIFPKPINIPAIIYSFI